MAWVSRGRSSIDARAAGRHRSRLVLCRSTSSNSSSAWKPGSIRSICSRTGQERLYRSPRAVDRGYAWATAERQLRFGSTAAADPLPPRLKAKSKSSASTPVVAQREWPQEPRASWSLEQKVPITTRTDTTGSPAALFDCAPRCSNRPDQDLLASTNILAAHIKVDAEAAKHDPRAHPRRSPLRDPRRRGDLHLGHDDVVKSSSTGIMIPTSSYYWFVSSGNEYFVLPPRRREGQGLSDSTTVSTSTASRFRATGGEQEVPIAAFDRAPSSRKRIMADAITASSAARGGARFPRLASGRRVRGVLSILAGVVLWEVAAGRTFLNNPLFFAPLRRGPCCDRWPLADGRADADIAQFEEFLVGFRAGVGRGITVSVPDGELEDHLRDRRPWYSMLCRRRSSRSRRS